MKIYNFKFIAAALLMHCSQEQHSNFRTGGSDPLPEASSSMDSASANVSARPSDSPSVSPLVTTSPTPSLFSSTTPSPSPSPTHSFTANQSINSGSISVGGSGLILLSDISATTITAAWTKATMSGVADPTLKYCPYIAMTNNLINPADVEGNGTLVQPCTADLDQINLVGLTPSTVYYFNLIVKDGAGHKASYQMASGTTTTDLIAPIAGNSGTIALSNVTPLTATLSWYSATDNFSSASNVQYLVYYSTANNLSGVAATEANGTADGVFAANLNNKNIINLIPSTTYYFNVIAKDEAGNKVAYNSASTTTGVDIVPPSPGGSGVLTFSNYKSAEITLSWSAATDNLVSQSALRYEVRQSAANNLSPISNAEANGTVVAAYTAGITSKVISGLTPEVPYYYTVIVKDTAGNKALYAVQSAVTSRTKISSSGSTTCVLSQDSGLRCFGLNNYGNLGYGDTTDRGRTPGSVSSLAPIQFGTNRTARFLSVGTSKTCVILDDATLKCWGRNANGALGYDDVADRGTTGGATAIANLPAINLGAGRTALAVSSGSDHTCAILDTQLVKCWGNNTYGQLGVDDTNARSDGVQGGISTTPTVALGTGRTAKTIATGNYFTCAILDNDSLKCWGYNTLGQLGLGDTTNRGNATGANSVSNTAAINLGVGRTAKSISATEHHVCAVLDNDSLKCWGYNFYGALGLDDANNRGNASTPATLATVNLGSGRTAKKVVAGLNQTCAILDTGDVKCWGLSGGYDDYVSRGSDNSDFSMSLVPTINIGSSRTAKDITIGCVIRDDERVLCWGLNRYGELGQEHPYGIGVDKGMSSLPALNFGSGKLVTALSQPSDGSSTCAILLGDNSLRCWGDNSLGQLGYDDILLRGHTPGTFALANIPAVNLGAGRSAKSVVNDSTHSCAILDNDNLKCWGYNGTGELGLDDTITRSDTNVTYGMANLPNVNLGSGRTAKKISVGGGGSTCAILDTNAVKCWGICTSLGLDDNINRGDTSVTYGMANLPTVDLGSGRTAKNISLSVEHTCAILDDNSLKCWGFNSHGQLGQNNTDSVGYGTGSNPMSSLAPIYLGSGRTAAAVSTAYNRTCAILDDGSVKCWGRNSASQLGFSDRSNRGHNTTYSMENLPTLNLGSGRTALRIASGMYHNCVVLDDHSVKCWGKGSDGALGYDVAALAYGMDSGSFTLATLPGVNLGNGRTAKEIYAGGFYTCALLDNDSVKCWGMNYGSLGYNDMGSRGLGIPMSEGIVVPVP